MLFGFWSWVLVIVIVGIIFYANKLPQLRKQAEEKLKEGKIMLEKSKKELEAKASVLTEKAKEKQQALKSVATKKTSLSDEEKEITIEDLAFMPKEETKNVPAENKTKSAPAKKETKNIPTEDETKK